MLGSIVNGTQYMGYQVPFDYSSIYFAAHNVKALYWTEGLFWFGKESQGNHVNETSVADPDQGCVSGFGFF